MDLIRKSIDVRLCVCTICLIFLANMYFKFSFIEPIALLAIVCFVFLKFYLSKNIIVIAYFVGLFVSAVILYPVFTHLSSFALYMIPIIFDSIIAVVLMIYCLYKIYKSYLDKGKLF